MKKQIITARDPLYDLKSSTMDLHPGCSFFEHKVNRTIDIGCGTYKGNRVSEKIITDGKISLHRRNLYQPCIIWQNTVIALENGLSISIDISEATFMVNVIRFGNKTAHEIHVTEEDRASLQTILNFLYHKQPISRLSTITFKSPSVLLLESTLKGEEKHSLISFDPAKRKKYKRRWTK